MGKQKNKEKTGKKRAGRPITQHIERIPDTPENVARAMFGLKPIRKKEEEKQVLGGENGNQ